MDGEAEVGVVMLRVEVGVGVVMAYNVSFRDIHLSVKCGYNLSHVVYCVWAGYNLSHVV